MSMLSILGLFLSGFWVNTLPIPQSLPFSNGHQQSGSMMVIDSMDIVTIDMDQALILGQIIEVPVFIQSDEVINALDFSMALNVDNLEFESVVDHTGNLQYAAHFNPKDLKLRFTSNSFSSYPMEPVKVVSIRIRVLSGAVFPSDIQGLMGYLNGDRCKALLQFSEEVLPVSNKEIITNETFITPNPVMDEMYIQAGEDGTLDLFDVQGRAVIHMYRFRGNEINKLYVDHLPNGAYTARVITADHKVKTQQIILQ